MRKEIHAGNNLNRFFFPILKSYFSLCLSLSEYLSQILDLEVEESNEAEGKLDRERKKGKSPSDSS